MIKESAIEAVTDFGADARLNSTITSHWVFQGVLVLLRESSELASKYLPRSIICVIQEIRAPGRKSRE